MSVITLLIILYDELIRVVVTQIFRACRIKKGRKSRQRTIRRRARRENHSNASTARAERRSIGKCHLKSVHHDVHTNIIINKIKLSVCVIIFNEDLINMWYKKKSVCQQDLSVPLNRFIETLEILRFLLLQLLIPLQGTIWIMKHL